MGTLEIFRNSNIIFEDFYFKADTDSLCIYLTDDSSENHELEIEFSPAPACYRYTVEEVLHNISKEEKTPPRSILQTYIKSDWKDSFSFEKPLEIDKTWHYEIQLNNQTFDILSAHQPNVCWRDVHMEKIAV